MTASPAIRTGLLAIVWLLSMVILAGHEYSFSSRAHAGIVSQVGPNDFKGPATLDLSAWDPVAAGPRPLSGNWDFFGNQFITPDLFQRNIEPSGKLSVQVPDTWKDNPSILTPMGSFGFATYHVHLKLPEGHDPLGLRITRWNMAWRLFANGTEIGSLGNPDPDSTREWSHAKHVIVPLPDATEIDLVVHISNHIFFRGGLVQNAVIGRIQDLEIDENWTKNADVALTSIFAFLFTIFFCLYLTQTRRRDYLALAVLSALLAIRLIAVNRIIGDVFPEFPMIVLARAEYVPWFCLPLNYYLYLRLKFPKETSLPITAILGSVAFFGALFSVAAPIGLLILIRPIGIANTLLAIGAGLYTIGLAMLANRPQWRTMAFVTVVTAGSALNDLAVTFHLVSSVTLLPASFILMIISQLIGIGSQLETQITEGEKRVQVLTDSLPVALFQILVKPDKQFEVLYVSSGFERLLGITPNALTDTNRLIEDLVAAQDRDQLLGELRRAITTDELVEFSFRLATHDPFERWIEIQAKRRYAQGSDILLEGLLRDVTAQKELEGKLRDLATTDSLTGLSNRRHFIESTQRELARANRFGHSVALLVVDADHFKTINDTYGHAAGDVVLVEIARRLREGTRDVDIIGRLGGEEFGLTLPETDAAGAILTAERLRMQVGGKPIMVNDLAITATISIGVVTEHSSSGDLGKMFVMADRAMYHAKKKGRNRVIVADQSAGDG